MNKAKWVLRRLRRFRSDRALRWVFPSVNNYTVATWRRINPRYNMSGGDFGGINEFQLTDVTYCRTRIGALLAQVIMGREKWTDGFKQQVVEIIEPGNAIRTLMPPTVSFDDYPTHDKPDLMPNVDKNCITLPNGDCIADVDCMHTPDDERLPGCLDDDKLKHPYGRLGDFRPDAE